MKNKNWIKICLDIVMAVLLILMYNKQVISMSFHEVGGLIVIGLFLIHSLLNIRWITGVTKKIFSKQLPVRTKIGYLINFLLLICVILIAVSGLHIGKTITILSGSGSGNNFWKLAHFTSAAVALILVGIHVGLHWTFIKGTFGKIIKIPAFIGKPLGICLMIALLVFGSYNMATSNFSRWISMPFSISMVNNQSAQPGGPAGIRQERGQKPTDEQRSISGQKPERSETGNNINLSNVLNVIVAYLSIMSVFAIIAYQIDKLIRFRKSLGVVNAQL